VVPVTASLAGIVASVSTSAPRSARARPKSLPKRFGALSAVVVKSVTC
jgi:hypothetical protein